MHTLRCTVMLGLLCVVTASSTAGPGPATLALYARKDYVLHAALQCTTSSPSGVGERWPTYRVGGPGGRFLWATTVPVTQWQDTIHWIVRDFVRICSGLHTSSCPHHPASTLNDSTFVHILMTMLSDTLGNKGGMRGPAWEARGALVDFTSFPALQAQSAYLKAMLDKSPLKDKEKNDLLVFARLTEKEKKSLLARGDLKLAYRARLGDRAAEDTLLANYDAAATYGPRAAWAAELGLAGTARCLEHLIRTFNEPVYEEKGWAQCSSIRLPILLALRRHHPEEPMLNRELPVRGDSTAVTACCAWFHTWAETTYGVMPEKPEPPLAVLERSCSDCPFFNMKYLPDSLKPKADKLLREITATGISAMEVCR